MNFIWVINSPRWTVKKVTYMAILTALCVVGRISFQAIPNVQPMMAIILWLTFQTGWKNALIIGEASMVLTSFYFGFGIWVLAQVLGVAAQIFFLRLLMRSKVFRKMFLLQVLYAFFSGFLYGFVVSLVQVVLYGTGFFIPYWIAGLPFDLLTAVSAGGFYLLLVPILTKCFRVK